MRIDAHQHFWQYNPVRDAWITDDMAALQQDFLPDNLQPILQSHGFDGCVAVQADQSEEETAFLLSLAEKNSFIKGVVGWIDLAAANLEERLAHYRQFEKLKGFRQVWQHAPQRDLMLQPAIKQGIGALSRFGFTYDLLVFPDQLPFCTELVALFPGQPFVLDHLAKPPIKEQKIGDWQKDLLQLAQHRNVSCKVSGLVTEAAWNQWKKDDFRPYLDAVVEAFGTDRLLFGSDWPVCLLAASYTEVVQLVEDYFSSFTQHEKQNIFGGNAVRFYNLSL